MAFLAVIGHPVAHSLSPLMHNSALWLYNLPYKYLAIDVPPASLEKTVNILWNLEFVGFNITIPHKERVAEMSVELSEEASITGAVNTTLRRSDGWKGFNTDVQGFISSLSRLGIKTIDTCLLLGAGGSARAAIYALDKIGTRKIIIANRTRERAARLAESMRHKISCELEIVDLSEANNFASKSELLVNATPVGLVEDKLLIDPEALDGSQVIYDLVYSHKPTPLIRAARSKGCRIIDGVVHLVEQGAASFKIWTGVSPDTSFMERVVRNELWKRWKRSGAGQDKM
jgi:shikimate dehydrogenase